MRKIQIACNPENWDTSTITALGLTKNGRQCLPRSVKAYTLPEPWLTVWHGLVETLKSVAPGEWAASFITAHLSSGEGENNTVQLTISRRWDDATTDAPLTLTLDAAEAVSFFNYITENE